MQNYPHAKKWSSITSFTFASSINYLRIKINFNYLLIITSFIYHYGFFHDFSQIFRTIIENTNIDGDFHEVKL